MNSRTVHWSDLPKELLALISKNLDTRTDILRFRAVCSPWRSSIPLFPVNSPSFPIELPFPIVPDDAVYKNRRIHFTLTESTVYRIEQPPLPEKKSQSKSWFVKVEESKPGKFRLLNPLSKDQIKQLPSTFPNVLNLLEYRFLELSKAYTLQYVSGNYRVTVDKAIFSSNSMDDFSVLVIYHGGKLASWKLGDEKWTVIGERWSGYYTDIILYKGEFHAINRWGEVVVIDSLFKLTKISSRLYGGGSVKHFVESCGDLYVVDRYLDTDKRVMWWDENEEVYYYKDNDDDYDDMTVDFRLYKFNEEERNWVEVKSLGDQVLFLGVDCAFFVSAQDFAGCKGNCIYFTDDNYFHYSRDEDDVLKGLHCHSPGVFNLEDRSIGKLASFQAFLRYSGHPQLD